MIGHESDSVPRKKPEPLDVGLNRVVLEPVTKIMRFEGDTVGGPKGSYWSNRWITFRRQQGTEEIILQIGSVEAK
jgi:hypothetical protein